MRNACRYLLLLPLGLLATQGARADSLIVGGSSLLTQADANQLAAWLGEGDLTLTNIFTKTAANDTPEAFSAAVDGQGRTFVVLEATPESTTSPYPPWTSIGSSMLLGGYDPLSWDSTNGYNITTDRSGFIFNLTTSTMQDQNSDISGQTQTYNSSIYGPAFGDGFDLGVGVDLGTDTLPDNLDHGYAYNSSYGGTTGGINITGGGAPNQYEASYFDVTGLEVFTITDGVPSVPEPRSSVLIVPLVGALLLLGRRAQLRCPALAKRTDRA